MAEDAARSRLGRGLAALIGDVGTESSAERPRGQRRVATSSLRPNARNPRRNFSEADLDELTASLRERGMIQPIVARPVRGVPDAYEIIAGERRWRAAQRAGLHEVPVVIIEATDEESLQLAIIENVQRADLNPLEEAEGYRALVRRLQPQPGRHRQNGRQEPQPCRQYAAAAEAAARRSAPTSSRQARRRPCPHAGRPAQCRDNSPTKSSRAASTSVRSRRSRARNPSRNGKSRSRKPSAEKNADTLALEKRLSDALGLVVSIDARGESGVVSIRYRNLDQLDDLARRLEKKRALKDVEVLSLFPLRVLLSENRIPVFLVGGADRFLAFASAVA